LSILIGITALQGDFAEHGAKLRSLGHSTREVRRVSDLGGLDALIIPGGESTANAIIEHTLTALHSDKHEQLGLFDAIKEKALAGLPVWGTCMGSILLAKDIENSSQGRIGIMDISVRRNAFGPQKFSSEVDLDIPVVGKESFPGIFIRAPLFIAAGTDVEILCHYSAGFVMARQGHLLATAFHPEITGDDRIHEYFVEQVVKGQHEPLANNR
jgi:pyridoxal 5'-phosphate synthase pdxT subunit